MCVTRPADTRVRGEGDMCVREERDTCMRGAQADGGITCIAFSVLDLWLRLGVSVCVCGRGWDDVIVKALYYHMYSMYFI